MKRNLSFALSSIFTLSFALACTSPKPTPDKEDVIDIGDGDGDGDLEVDIPEGLDWPATPRAAEDAPGDGSPAALEALKTMFTGTAIGAACVTEPQDGTMIPKNWLRPRFRAQGTATAYQVTLSSELMTHDFVGYGGPNGWSLPVEFWNGIASKATTGPVVVNVTVRVHNGTGFTEAVSTFQIAPVLAGGSMVYWASNESRDNVASSRLEGFSVGEEGTITALTPTDVAEDGIRDEIYGVKSNAAGQWAGDRGAAPGKPSCIGCHTSTPDGLAVAFNDGYPWAGITASIEESTKGQRAVGVTDLGARLLKTPFIGTIAFSAGHYSSGDRRAISTFTPWGVGPYEGGRNIATAADLIWVNLEAAGEANLGTDGPSANAAFTAQMGSGWGYINRDGDTRAAANPNWNETGDLIAYASVARVAGSHVGGILGTTVAMTPDTVLPDATEADLYTVPYNGGAGGVATPVAGASEPGVAEYYPDFSPDSKFLAFNRAATNTGYIYYRPDGEVSVIPTGGGVPHRLEANSPPVCSGETSPGVINSWPKWGPSYETVGGKTYYWIVFSSARDYVGKFVVPPDVYTPTSLDTRSSQLYLTAVVVEGETITSYPGLYVWNQTTDTSNLTPAWDKFAIPPVPVVR